MQGARAVKSFPCICCPLGCRLEAALASDGTVEAVAGQGCRHGLEYAVDEATNPVRMVSAVVPVAGCLEPLSVKTAQPVPKGQIRAVLDDMLALQLEAPVCAGDVLIANVRETGVPVVATKSVP
ncbi:DUF1667 domain-containing protein [Eggerthellaceae bacterium zg-887]|uniref:DUF1667 domain-containing protein n=1 Tax=Xiamenia xianingshaonis TaxID=2682776 RepID=UPI001409FC83|nr:DUF1667 domain-containing protein [Xiamenia xianingshaonis]NHM16972.1 DUF1667 domain-containing protein [Xiamenia xianingshaonis]